MKKASAKPAKKAFAKIRTFKTSVTLTILAYCGVLVLASAPNAAFAQELKATVSVDYTLITADQQRDDLSSMKQDLMRYLNKQSFTGKEFKNETDQEKVRWKDEPVEIDVSITITSYNEGKYNGQVLMVAKRNVFGGKGSKTVTFVAFDKQFTGFEYRRNSDFTFQLYRFDSFTSLIDFYVNIALGMDLDTYYDLGGLPLYQQAQQILQGAPTDWQNTVVAGEGNRNEAGTLTRLNLITELLDPRYNDFRKNILLYHVEGIDFLNDDKPKALQALRDAVIGMSKFKDKLPVRSVLMQYFFDAKFRELCDVFRKTEYAEKVFSNLKYLDVSHSTQYSQAESGK